jgi:3-hydroxyacyl-CoA dehydrogenase/enoyl-CoA hydratase/3-hydroxybutyryl-CoA epimerase
MTEPVPPATPPERRDDGAVLLRGEGGIATLLFERPGAPNVVGTALLERLDTLLTEVEAGVAAGAVRALVLRSARPGVFLAGADLAEVRAVTTAAQGTAKATRGQQVLRRLERLDIPTFAAVSGTCLGAGLEVALACSYRLGSAAPETRLGLPEVRFGLLPALGGTVRLPRLVGLRAALELVVSGRAVDAGEARALGLLDEVYPAARFGEGVAAFVEERLRRGRRRTGARRGVGMRLVEDTAPGRRVVFRQFRAHAAREAGGNPAPLRAVEVVADAAALPLDQAFAREAAAFGELVVTPESRGFLHAAGLRRVARPAPGVAAPSAPERAVVLGGGAPGGMIAYRLAAAGVQVRLRDPHRSAVAEGLRLAREGLARDVAGRALSSGQAAERAALLSGAPGFGGFGTAEVLLEALAGGEQAKRAALREAEEHLDPRCVLAATSLALPVERLAEALEHPGRMAGLRLFPSPAAPRLAEVVRAPGSAPATVAALHALARRLGVPAVVAADTPGALLFRLAVVYVDEAVRLLEEGATVGEVDGAMEEFGMAPGPLRLADQAGVPALGRAAVAVSDAFPGRVRPPAALEVMMRREFLGAWEGRGFYRYATGGRARPDSTVVEALRAAAAPGEARPPKSARPSAEALRERMLLVLVNEAAHALDDGVVSTAAEVDFAVQHALGFPPSRGGLLYHAGQQGLARVAARLEELAAAHGERFSPAPRVRRLADEGAGFYSR